MKTIFEQTSLAGVPLKNRILRSATFEGMCGENDGPSPKHTKMYTAIASGGAGAIITGIVGVRQDGKAFPRMPMIDNDAILPAFRKMTDAVHKAGAPIFCQVMHAGRQTDTATTLVRPVAPSALRDRTFFWDKPRALSNAEVPLLIESFVRAVARAKEAGFDGVQIHAAHGFLLSQFLSPYTNRRKDQWGGSTQNRCRIVVEILQRSRGQVGDFPLLVRINANDNRRGGVRPDEAVAVARILEKAGADALDVSCGVFEDGFNTIRVTQMPRDAMLEKVPQFRFVPKPARRIVRVFLPLIFQTAKPVFKYNVDAAEKVRQNVKIPVIVAGGIRSLADMESVLVSGAADYISMGRPFFREPDIVNKLATGQATQSACISCGQCLAEMSAGETRCVYA